jgi:hypothetical protein
MTFQRRVLRRPDATADLVIRNVRPLKAEELQRGVILVE